MSNVHISESPWFSYRDGGLVCEEVPLESIAAEVDTPAFVYSGAAIDDAYRNLHAAGTSKESTANLLSFDDFNDVIGLDGYYDLDKKFKL